MKKNVKIVCLCLAAVGVAGACVGSVYGGIALAGASVSSDVCGLPDDSIWVVGMSRLYSGSEVEMHVVRKKYRGSNLVTVGVPDAIHWQVWFDSSSPWAVKVPGQPGDLSFYDLRACAGSSGRWEVPEETKIFVGGASSAEYAKTVHYTWDVSLYICTDRGVYSYRTLSYEIVGGPGVYLLSFGDQIDASTANISVSHADYPLCAGEVSSK